MNLYEQSFIVYADGINILPFGHIIAGKKMISFKVFVLSKAESSLI